MLYLSVKFTLDIYAKLIKHIQSVSDAFYLSKICVVCYRMRQEAQTLPFCFLAKKIFVKKYSKILPDVVYFELIPLKVCCFEFKSSLIISLISSRHRKKQKKKREERNGIENRGDPPPHTHKRQPLFRTSCKYSRRGQLFISLLLLSYHRLIPK